MMQKRWLKLSIYTFFLILSAGTYSFAQEDISERLGGLLDEAEFGYTSDNPIKVKSITSDKITLESPMLIGALDETIIDYAVIYNDKPIGDTFSDASLLDDFKEKDFVISEDEADPFSIELKTEDGLDPDKVYYLYAVPKDEFGIPGLLSNEICFQLSSKKFAEDEEDCKDFDEETNTDNNNPPENNHASGGPDMTSANITHTVNGDKVTLKRTSQNGANKLELFLRDPNDERFEKLATANMSDQQYTFTTSRNGEHNVKFIPMDSSTPNGTEKIYTFTLQGITPGPEPTPGPTPTPNGPVTGITKVPVVGPEQNIAIIFILSVIGYFLYRRVRRKS